MRQWTRQHERQRESRIRCFGSRSESSTPTTSSRISRPRWTMQPRTFPLITPRGRALTWVQPSDGCTHTFRSALSTARIHTITLSQQDALMSAKIAAAAFILFVAGPLAAQAPAYIVTPLGTDTVAIERYTRSPGKLEGDFVVRNPRVQTFHYAADLGPRGQLKTFHL